MFHRLTLGAAALSVTALAIFATSLTVPAGPALASGQYCDAPSVVIQRRDLAPSEVQRRCREAADLFGEVAITRGTVCEICPRGEVKTVGNTIGTSTGGDIKAPPIDEPDLTPPNPLPAGIEIVKSRPLRASCGQPPTDYLLRISASSNCPSGYITRGKEWLNGSIVQGVRWCAVCPGGYVQHKLDRFKCCIPNN